MYLDSLNKKGINSREIVNKICKGRQIIGGLSSLWWNKSMSLDTKSCQEKLQLNQWLSMDVKYGLLRQSSKENYQLQKWALQRGQLECPFYKKFQTPPSGAKCKQNNQFLQRIRTRQLKWYEHLFRMEDSRWPKKIYQ